MNLHASRLLRSGAAAPPMCPLARAGRLGATSGEKAAAERDRRARRAARRGCIGRTGSRVDKAALPFGGGGRPGTQPGAHCSAVDCLTSPRATGQKRGRADPSLMDRADPSSRERSGRISRPFDRMEVDNAQHRRVTLRQSPALVLIGVVAASFLARASGAAFLSGAAPALLHRSVAPSLVDTMVSAGF